MAKKVVKKKKATAPKADTTPKAEACSGCEILIALGIVAAVVAGIMYFAGYFDTKIESGQCYINRAYQPVKVITVYKYLDEVTLRPMEVKESSLFGGFYLEEDYSKDRIERTLDFVKDNYTPIKCANYDL